MFPGISGDGRHVSSRPQSVTEKLVNVAMTIREITCCEAGYVDLSAETRTQQVDATLCPECTGLMSDGYLDRYPDSRGSLYYEMCIS